MIKNPSAMQEIQVQFLDWEDPLEKEMATHSSILAWEIPWTKEPGELQSMGSQRVRHDWATKPPPPSIQKKINHEYSLEGLTLKPKLQYFCHLLPTADSLEKNLILGETEGKRRKGWQRKRWLDSIINLMDMSLSKFREIEKDRKAWHANGVTEMDMTWQLNNNYNIKET